MLERKVQGVPLSALEGDRKNPFFLSTDLGQLWTLCPEISDKAKPNSIDCCVLSQPLKQGGPECLVGIVLAIT